MLAINNLHTRAYDKQIPKGADFRNGEECAEYWVAVNGWLRLPGLFWSSDVESIGDRFLVEEAGHERDGTPLYAVYASAEKNNFLPR